MALVVALGGTAYAGLLITGKNVRNGSLTGADVRDGSVGSADVRAGAGLKLRYVATTWYQEAGTLARGDAVCPKGMYAIGGGVSGYGSMDLYVARVPGAQVVNAAFPLDGNDPDRIPERYAGFVYNNSSRKLNFEVDAVCASAARASSNFTLARATQAIPKGAVRATRVRLHRTR